jgi:hypothetical protein
VVDSGQFFLFLASELLKTEHRELLT